MTDDDVRDMLRARADSITPGADGLERIEAKLAGDVPVTAGTTRHRSRMPMLAAAALVVVALIGAVLFVERDDSTNVAVGPETTVGGFAAYPLGVWPWPGDDVDGAALAEPEDAARSYVEARVGHPVENGFVAAAGDDRRVTFTGDVSTEVFLRKTDETWYVVSAASDLVTLHDAGDGTTTARVETAGTLLRQTAISDGAEASGSTTTVEGGEEYPGLAYDLGRDDVAKRELFVLDTGDGTTGITEVSFRPPPDDTAATTTTVVASPATTRGVWPTGNDDIDAATLSDPVATAARYLADTVGTTESTVLSDFRQGDTTSGEVEVSGDIEGTLVMRELDGRWQVEAVISPLVESAELRPGEVQLIARSAGTLSVLVLDDDGHVVQSMPDRGVVNGEEALVVPDAPDGTPLTVRWWLEVPATDGASHGVTGIGHVRLYGGASSSVEHAVPDDALSAEGGLDARETASRYLADRLGGRTVTVAADAAIDGDRAEVSWEAGVVLLQQADGYWYVVEAIGDSVQIGGTSLDAGYVSGTLHLAQAGTVHLSVGDTTWDVRNDIDREGTDVRFEHDISTAEPVILRAVFETDTGYVSLAEKVIG